MVGEHVTRRTLWYFGGTPLGCSWIGAGQTLEEADEGVDFRGREPKRDKFRGASTVDVTAIAPPSVDSQKSCSGLDVDTRSFE
jgi:hypothetical protein